LQVSGQV